MESNTRFHTNQPNGRQRVARWLIPAIAVAITVGATVAWQSSVASAADDCPGGTTELTAAFADTPDGLQGADYQRAIGLPDGRRLWTFQDAFVARPGNSDSLVHNVGVVQDGACFRLLRSGTADNPRPWLAGESTRRYQHWFWPLGATLPGDGTVRIFLAEFEERGARYLANSTPVATWLATLDVTSLELISLTPAPDPSPALYGWSVASDDEFTYLYGHCYRQFGFGFLGHDGCTASVTVARTSHNLSRPLEYWNGTGWTTDAAAAANVAPTTAPDGTARAINPTQVARAGTRWIAVTKEGDWWGSRIYVDVAVSPTGPWRTVAVVDAAAPNADENTYFASIIEVDPASGSLVIGLSHNRWDGAESSVYRPTFQTVTVSTLLDVRFRTPGSW